MDAAAARYGQLGGEAAWRGHVAVEAAQGADIGGLSERPDATLKEILAALHKQESTLTGAHWIVSWPVIKLPARKRACGPPNRNARDVARARRKWILIRSRCPSANSRPTCVG